MTLKDLPIGKTATILKVGGEGALRQHFLDMGVIRLLVVQNPLAEVLPRFLRIAVAAAAIAASFLVELHGHIEVMRPDIFAQDKAAAV